MKYFKYKIYIIFLLVFTFSCNQEIETKNYEDKILIDTTEFQKTPERLKPIVDSIIKKNIVESEHITIAGFKSKNYRNFETLKSLATTPELVKLTNNKNTTVACYASWALADQSYTHLNAIFKNFLKHARTVKTHSGCIMSEDHLASELYHRYWNNPKNDDKILKGLDSIILFSDKPNWLLLNKALDNRVYYGKYKNRIVKLAFEEANREALFYLNNLHKAEYYEEIKTGLLQYLKDKDFKTTGTSDYFKTVEELLRFKSSAVNDEIIEKMKKDKHWHHEPEKFRSLLEHYNIYYFSWKPN